jgi:hypothetical protein
VRELFATLRPSINTLLRDWAATPGEERAGGDARARELDVLCSAVLDLAGAADDAVAEAERACERAALEHGRGLRAVSLDEQSIFEECDLIRRAVWHYVQRQVPNGDRAAEAIAHVDAAITLATVAALRGYHVAEAQAAP